jgi:pimeloyl-ACP methyl ester carboxylesterase
MMRAMFGLPDHPIARFVNLWFNVGQAFRVPFLQVPRSIAGNLASHAAPDGYETELGSLAALDGETLGTVLRAGGVAWPLFARLDSGPLEIAGRTGPGDDERWFFLNGICTDHRIARLNARLLTKVTGRSVTVLYNATEGFVLDLVECAFGKAWDYVTDAAAANLEALMDALCDPLVRRVVLVSHSQGTIVAAVLLKTLEELLRRAPIPSSDLRPERAGEQKVSGERRAARRIVDAAQRPSAHPDFEQPKPRPDLTTEDIGKLELYCFANCATSMEPFARVSDPCLRLAPWIESFGNEYDVVAKLGLLAPPHGIGSARIAGDRYRLEGAWGHLFNAHYGIPILVHRQQGTAFRDNLRTSPRLFEYLDGGVPERMP